MKGVFSFILLIASTQAIDINKLKPVIVTSPVIRPHYNETYWNSIKSNQEVKLEQYPGYKRGSNPQPASAGLSLQTSHQTRITGGSAAVRGQFPWQVYLDVDGSYFCGGSLISEEWVLTAAHCAYGFRTFIVALDTIRVDLVPGLAVVTSAEHAYVHASYDKNTVNNDIAVIKLPRKVGLSEHINPVRLPSYAMADDDLVGETVTVSGWGRTSDNIDQISPDLRFVSMQVIKNKECTKTYGDIITSTKVCTSTSGGHSPCNGDSGGPLVLKMSDGKYREVGIVSFGASGGCEKNYPSGFTRVTSYLQWIETKTGIQIDSGAQNVQITGTILLCALLSHLLITFQ